MVLYIYLVCIVLTFESVDEILCQCDHENETSSAVLSHQWYQGAVSRNSAKLGNYQMPVKLRETYK